MGEINCFEISAWKIGLETGMLIFTDIDIFHFLFNVPNANTKHVKSYKLSS